MNNRKQYFALFICYQINPLDYTAQFHISYVNSSLQKLSRVIAERCIKQRGKQRQKRIFILKIMLVVSQMCPRTYMRTSWHLPVSGVCSICLTFGYRSEVEYKRQY